MSLSLILILICIILGMACFFIIKRSFSLSKQVKELKKVKKIEKEAVESRIKRENESNEKVDIILNSNIVDHGVLPDGEITHHNHAFGKSCSTYNKAKN